MVQNLTISRSTSSRSNGRKDMKFTPSQLPATVGNNEITCGNSYSTLYRESGLTNAGRGRDDQAPSRSISPDSQGGVA
jgi:hypothetical protein